jgi:threonylcarbamoyladenosine tRNA methylthiotransferase MtaB
MGSFHIENFGCRAARADGEAIADRLLHAGCSVQQPFDADLVVVNTCSVTAEADRAARAMIRRVHRRNPAARIVVTGCYAQRAPEELAAMQGVTAVVGNSHKALAPEILLGLLTDGGKPAGAQSGFVSLGALQTAGNAPVWADESFAHSFLEEAQLTPGAQTRPNLKVQEGCSNRCSFCVIPQTRGGNRSLAAEAVLKQVRGFVAAGGRELVLSGINLGRWSASHGSPGAAHGSPAARIMDNAESAATSFAAPGVAHEAVSGAADGGLSSGSSSPQPRNLAALVRTIFAETELPRLRLSSIEPMDWDRELLAVLAEFAAPSIASPRLARHAHLPLQSGSDAVLRRMFRRYRPWHYEQKVEALFKAAGEDLTLGADVMVGFPGETEAEFQETVSMIRRLPFAYLHLFPFSPRPNTPAQALHAAHPVPPAIVQERMDALRALAAEKGSAHRSRFLGRTMDAITLHTPPELTARNKTSALTENFLPVELEGSFAANHLLRIEVLAVEEALLARPLTIL